jgi:IPT/TIG domain
LNKKDFSAKIVNSSDSTKFNLMNVIAANDTEKTLTFMYGGAWSGIYNLSLRHNQYGLINTRGLYITVGSNITSISPNTGSIYGGTLLTITGTNYGT